MFFIVWWILQIYPRSEHFEILACLWLWINIGNSGSIKCRILEHSDLDDKWWKKISIYEHSMKNNGIIDNPMTFNKQSKNHFESSSSSSSSGTWPWSSTSLVVIIIVIVIINIISHHLLRHDHDHDQYDHDRKHHYDHDHHHLSWWTMMTVDNSRSRKCRIFEYVDLDDEWWKTW